MKHESVNAMFSRAAERFGARAAIEGAGRRLTYAELDELSNSLANYLLARGAAKGSIVAILAEDSVEVITAILAILKAGCVFVPLDAKIPDKRLEAMVAHVAPSWFIAEAKSAERVERISHGVSPRPGVLRVDERAEFKPGREHFDPLRPKVASAPDDHCYVYFTSGSTGQPKAIAGRLKGIDHFIRWEIETLDLGEGVRVSQLLPPSFDGSLRDIFVPLCAGGTVCVPEGRDAVLDPRRLIEWLDRERVGVIHCVPSLFRSMLGEELDPARFSSLKYVLMAGEPLLPSDVKRWTEVYGERIQLVNLYGTSETTMAKFAYFVKAADAGRRSVPVGKPIEGAAAIVVDERGRPCSPGTIGEIYIRTPYRALGYYKQPELTAEVFIPNPFRDDPADIVYRTGDLGRVLEDGNFEYLGRRDQQVKIRGVRVELGEIENLLRGHEAVRDVAVVDREDAGGGSNYLCAYTVLNRETKTETLRDYLSAYLPDYMLPSAFVVMEKLPRTISGKIDRRGLPVPGQSRAGLERDYVAPRTPIEEVVAGIWSEVLGVARVGVEDNFFQLGGHSLRATQILSRVRSALGAEVPLRGLFESPTVAGLSRRVASRLDSGGGAEVPPVVAVSRAGELPLSFAQQRLWFLHQLDPRGSTFNMHASIRLTGQLNLPALERTLAEVVRRHEVLRTTFRVKDGTPYQLISPPAPFDVEGIDLTRLPADESEAEASRLVALERRLPFDLSTGPLLRVKLIRLGAEEHVAAFTMHHIVSDGWSLGVLVREVGALYAAFAEGGSSPLPELPVQYADFAAWQREQLTGEALERQLAYWRGRLAGLRQLELPTDRGRLHKQNYRGAPINFALEAELARGLRELSRRSGVTLYMTLLAAFQTLLHRYTGQDDLAVGSPIAHRDRPETEGLIGCLINTLVMRTDLSGNPTFRDLLARVRETALGAYAHPDVPFEMLVEALQPARRVNRTPFFQVWFVLHNARAERLELPGLLLSPVSSPGESAQFDLTLSMVDAGQELGGVLTYDTDLFEADTVAEMLAQFTTLLEAVVAEPNARLLDIPLRGDAGREAEAVMVGAARAEDQFAL